jgi:hypothetical protein
MSNVLPFYLFLSLVDDTHILGLVSIITSIFYHFISQLASMGLINLATIQLGHFRLPSWAFPSCWFLLPL